MFCHIMNNRYTLPPHWKKLALSLSFELIATFTLRENHTNFFNSNSSNGGAMTLTQSRKLKRHKDAEWTTADANDENIDDEIFGSLHFDNWKIQFQWSVCAQIVPLKHFEVENFWREKTLTLRKLWLQKKTWWCLRSPDYWSFYHKKIGEA